MAANSRVNDTNKVYSENTPNRNFKTSTLDSFVIRKPSQPNTNPLKELNGAVDETMKKDNATNRRSSRVPVKVEPKDDKIIKSESKSTVNFSKADVSATVKDESESETETESESESDNENDSDSEANSSSEGSSNNSSDDESSSDSDYHEGKVPKKRARKTSKNKSMDDELVDEMFKHSEKPNAGISDYERIRLDNIRRNQELIAKLNLTEMSDITKSTLNSSSKRKPSSKRPGSVTSRSKVKTETVEPVRRSARVRGVKAQAFNELDEGASEDEDTKLRIKEEEEKKKQEQELLQKYRFGPIPIKVENGDNGAKSTTSFLSMLQDISTRSSIEEDAKQLASLVDSDDKEMRDFYSNVHTSILTPDAIKMNSERIMAMAMHPDRSKLLAISGDKSGSISFLDFTTFAKSVKNPDVNAPVEGIYSLKPHMEGVNDIKIDNSDRTKFYSCSYDGTIKMLDIASNSFDNLYTSEYSEPIQCLSQNAENGLICGVTHSGGLICLDSRMKKVIFDNINLAPKKLSFVEFNPIHSQYLATGGLNYTANIWDFRFLSEQKNRTNLTKAWDDYSGEYLELPGCVWSYNIGRAVNNTSWSPNGNKLVTTTFDNAIRVFNDPLKHRENQAAQESDVITIPHNNKTGKWVSLLRARWNPNSLRDSFIVGNMKRAIDVYSGKTGSMLSMLHDADVVTAIPAINAFHPNWHSQDDLWVSGNATGKVLLWTSRDENDLDI